VIDIHFFNHVLGLLLVWRLKAIPRINKNPKLKEKIETIKIY